MSRKEEVGPRLETRVKAPFPAPLDEWSALDYRLFALSIVMAALASVLVTLVPPFLAVYGHDVTACVAALLFDRRTGYNPLSFSQFIDLSRLAPQDILARWIYLPFLGFVSLVFALAGLGSARAEQTAGRNAAAAASALASLLYLILLLAYPVSRMLDGQCFCGNPEQSVLAATTQLRWGYYVALGLSLYIIVANQLLIATVPFHTWKVPQVHWVKQFCVIAVSPLEDAADIGSKPTVTATFSKGVRGRAITKETFTVSDPEGHPLTGTVRYRRCARTAMFTPDRDLKADTVYSAKINAYVTDRAGRPLACDCVWSFTTAKGPTVESMSPADGTTNVPITTAVQATFSEPMDDSTICKKTFILRGSNNKDVDGVVKYDSVRHEATFTPDYDLDPCTTYYAVIVEGSDGAKSKRCFPLDKRYAWKFTTGPKPPDEKCPEPKSEKNCDKPNPCEKCRLQTPPAPSSKNSAEATAQQASAQSQAAAQTATETTTQQGAQYQVNEQHIHISLPPTIAPPIDIKVSGAPIDIDVGGANVDISPLLCLPRAAHDPAGGALPPASDKPPADSSPASALPPDVDVGRAKVDVGDLRNASPAETSPADSAPRPVSPHQPTPGAPTTGTANTAATAPHFGQPIYPPSWPLPDEVPTPPASGDIRKHDPTDSGLPHETGSDNGGANLSE
jgi:Bacterial Ig-like domain